MTGAGKMGTMRQLTPTSARHRAIDTPHGTLAVLDAGPADGPGVILVPGYTGSKEDFAPVLDPIARAGYRVTALDLLGQFESVGDDDPAAYTVEACAADVARVAAEFDGPVHLLGHSFGGLVARAAVIADPGAYASLVLLDTGPAGIVGPQRERIILLRPVLAAGGMPAVYEARERLAAADPRRRVEPPELKAFLRRRFLVSSETGLKVMGEALLGEPDRVADLAGTGVPVMVAYGVDDDAWPPDDQAAMAIKLDARSAPIPDAAHSPAVENTDATVTALLAFWADSRPPPD